MKHFESIKQALEFNKETSFRLHELNFYEENVLTKNGMITLNKYVIALKKYRPPFVETMWFEIIFDLDDVYLINNINNDVLAFSTSDLFDIHLFVDVMVYKFLNISKEDTTTLEEIDNKIDSFLNNEIIALKKEHTHTFN